MADLAFLDKLNKEQLQIADKIITKAQEAGVDPRLALSLAYVESGFKMDKVGDAGEIGVMQVKPATAKMLGVDLKNLHEADTNIDTGLKYLKQGIDRYKDPQLGVVAYNAGHDAPFLLGKSESPPESTLNYLNKINSVGGFVPTAEAATEANAASEATIEPASEDNFRKMQAAGAGAAVGAGVGIGTDVKRGISAMGDARAAKAAQAAQAALQAAQISSGAPGALATGLPPAGGPNTAPPLGGKGTANYGKAVLGMSDFDANRAKNYSDAWKVAQQAHEAEAKIGPGYRMTPERANLMLPENVGGGPRGATRVPIPPVQAPTPSPLQKVGQKVNQAGAIMNKYPIASNALVGAGAGFQGQDAYERYSKGDIPGAAIAGIGAAGSLASMIPHPMTKAIGAGIGMASPAALMVLDKMRQQTEKQPQRALQSTDAMGNPLQ